MYSRTVLALPRYFGSASRSGPVVPNSSSGPTRPFAPAMPGIVWQTTQPAFTNKSCVGSSPVTNGTASGKSRGTALVRWGSDLDFGGVGPERPSAKTAVSKTTPTMMAVQALSFERARDSASSSSEEDPSGGSWSDSGFDMIQGKQV